MTPLTSNEEKKEDVFSPMASNHKITLPPYLNAEVQKKVDYRDGDIIVSVPAKSGTTWTMNIVHQIRSGGDAQFEDVYEEVPWLEVMQHPNQTVEQRVETFNKMAQDRRRAFKTHAAPPDIPLIDLAEGGKDVRYVVVVRNPEEALTSMKPFLEKQGKEWQKLWNMPEDMFKFPDYKSFYDKMVIENFLYFLFFDFVAKWWPLRNRDNVLFLHFSEMKKDHEGSVRKVAQFLGFQPTEEQWDSILEYTSFPWMKANDVKFENTKACAKPMLERGSMVRKGAVNRAREDGWTEEMSEEVEALGREILADEEAFQWLYTGARLDLAD